MTASSMVRGFWAELAENDGVTVLVGNCGRVFGRASCPHIVKTTREISSTSDINALVTASAFCVVQDCAARLNARAVLGALAAVGAAL